MRRRRFLGLAGGGALALTGGVAVDNVLLGYGTVTGTNLRDQDLESKLDQRLGPVDGRTLDVAGTTVTLEDDDLAVGDETVAWDASSEDVERVERERDLPDGALAQLIADVPAFRARRHDVEAVTAEAFFDRASEVDERAYSVAALRGPRVRDVSPSIVERFADADPADPEAIAYALVDAFREYTFYDAPRYVAGAVEDNVFRRTVDLRSPFASPTGFEALLEGDNHGFFCYDFAYRSIEAFHAVPAADQTVPVVGAYVRDARHKHAYTGLATVTRDGGDDGNGGGGDGNGGDDGRDGGGGNGDDGDGGRDAGGDDDGRDDGGDDVPTLLVTFLDYTPTTAAHSFGLTAAIGDDPNGYTGRHRATDVFWNHRTYT